jgi:hypothetical protein
LSLFDFHQQTTFPFVLQSDGGGGESGFRLQLQN